MLNEGWIAIARSMRDHPLVGFHLFAKPCDKTKGACQPAIAFIDLLMECRFAGGFVLNGGRKMEVKRGQLVGAVSWLAARWNWTPMAVRIWLDKLEDDAMIARYIPGASKDNKHVGRTATIITICNYDEYQQVATDGQQSQQQTNSNQTTNEQQQYKEEQGNKGTREQISESPKPPKGAEYENAFSEWWAAYPRKDDKANALKTYLKIVTGKHKDHKATPDELLAGARAYAASCKAKGTEPQFVKGPAAWLNAARWRDVSVAPGAWSGVARRDPGYRPPAPAPAPCQKVLDDYAIVRANMEAESRRQREAEIALEKQSGDFMDIFR